MGQFSSLTQERSSIKFKIQTCLDSLKTEQNKEYFLRKKRIIKCLDNIEDINNQIESLYTDKKKSESFYREDYLTETEFERSRFLDLSLIGGRLKTEDEEVDAKKRVGSVGFPLDIGP